MPQEYPVAAASVVPKASARLAGHGIYFLSAYDCGGLIDFSRVDPTTLGADRVATALAAAECYPLPELPEEPRRNTVEASRFGVDFFQFGLVRELVAASLRSCGIVSCLAAGGDAGFFAAALPELKAVESDFTLHGIRLAWERRRDRQA